MHPAMNRWYYRVRGHVDTGIESLPVSQSRDAIGGKFEVILGE